MTICFNPLEVVVVTVFFLGLLWGMKKLFEWAGLM